MFTPVLSEAQWRSRFDRLPAWQFPPLPTLVVAPHPDDESLAAGGLIATLRAHEIPVTVVAVTDGEACYPGVPGLPETRRLEQEAALTLLGVSPPHIHRLHLPDSAVATREDELAEQLGDLVAPGMHLVAPWARDVHPDHEACGRAAMTVAARYGVPRSSWFFWTWHHSPAEVLDGLPLVRLPLSPQALAQKQSAIREHASQLHHPHGGEPILPDVLLGSAGRSYEVFLPA